MIYNRNVSKVIKKRQTPMTVQRSTATLLLGKWTTTHVTPVSAYGCFQQITRFDNYLGAELALLPEGERLEASTVVWTTYLLQPGKKPEEGATSLVKADIVVDCVEDIKYKVLSARNKRYGLFYRAILGEVK